MNTDNKTPEAPEEGAMNKPVAPSAADTGESSPQAKPEVAQDAKPESPAAQTSADAAVAPVNEKNEETAAKPNDDGDAAKPQAQSEADNNKEAAVQKADVADAKDTTKDNAEDVKDVKAEVAKAEKRKGGGPRRVSGVVIGNKADKTARVRIERRVKHALYGKVIRRRTHLQAHDADNQCNIGDKVTLEESPRFSKTKSWRVVAITPGDGR